MNQQRPQPDEPDRLEALLDGTLPEDQAEALRSQAVSDEQLRSQIEMQQRIDLGIERLAAPCEDDADRVLAAFFPDTQTPPLEEPAARRPTWQRVAAIAALFVLAGVAVWSWLPADPPEGQRYSRPQTVVLAAVLNQAEASGFTPDWLCETDTRFRATFQEKLGQAVSMKPLPEDRQMLGLSYLARGRGEGVYMLARAQGRPVLVFFDRPELLTHYDMIPPKGMRLHRGSVGQVQVIEMSPLDAPAFLPYLTQTPQVWPTNQENPSSTQ